MEFFLDFTGWMISLNYMAMVLKSSKQELLKELIIWQNILAWLKYLMRMIKFNIEWPKAETHLIGQA